jgi:hypothetical protein
MSPPDARGLKVTVEGSFVSSTTSAVGLAHYAP